MSTNIAQLYANIPGLKQDFKMDWKDNTKADWATAEVIVEPEVDAPEADPEVPEVDAPEADPETDPEA